MSTQSPSGGGNAPIEYLWLSTTSPSLPLSQWSVAGTGAHLDPGTLTETTYFLRCARRLGCETYTGESNVVSKIVNGQGEACDAGDEVINLSGSADSWYYNNWVSSPNNLLGPVDGNSALFYDYYDQIKVQLPDNLPAGSQVTITWKRRDYGGSRPARMLVYESNGSGFHLNDILYNQVSAFHINSVITLTEDNVDVLWLRNKRNYADFEIDAITYCATRCISPVEYCTPEHNSTEYEYIDRVRVGDLT